MTTGWLKHSSGQAGTAGPSPAGYDGSVHFARDVRLANHLSLIKSTRSQRLMGASTRSFYQPQLRLASDRGGSRFGHGSPTPRFMFGYIAEGVDTHGASWCLGVQPSDLQLSPVLGADETLGHVTCQPVGSGAFVLEGPDAAFNNVIKGSFTM